MDHSVPSVTTDPNYDADRISDEGPLSLGEELRQARVSNGVTLDEAQRATRISRRYLEALENDDYAALPAAVFARGFLRSYAQFLDLDADALTVHFPGQPRPPTALPDPRAAGARVEVGRRQHDRRRLDPEEAFDPYRPPDADTAEHLASIPQIDMRAPGVRLGPWLVAGFVVLVVLAGVIAVVTLGDDEPATAPVAGVPGVVADSEIPIVAEAAVQEQPTIELGTMPDFRPRSVQDALTILRRSGLPFAVIEVFDATIPVGSVMEQAPLPGEPLDVSSTVTLVVSRGAVPNAPAPGIAPTEGTDSSTGG